MPQRATSMCHAVSVASGNAAASSNDRFPGLGMALRAGITAYSAQPPSLVSPKIPYLRHRLSSPDRQALQWSQEKPGATQIASPSFTLRTASPAFATTPEKSQPRIMGRGNL